MKIVIGGQLVKNEIAEIVKELKPKATITIMSDLEAATVMQNGEADLYLGSCDTGGGGALAMAIAFLGIDKTATVATQSSRKTPEEIKAYVKSGVVAFGFVENEYKYAVTNILKNIK